MSFWIFFWNFDGHEENYQGPKDHIQILNDN